MFLDPTEEQVNHAMRRAIKKLDDDISKKKMSRTCREKGCQDYKDDPEDRIPCVVLCVRPDKK